MRRDTRFWKRWVPLPKRKGPCASGCHGVARGAQWGQPAADKVSAVPIPQGPAWLKAMLPLVFRKRQICPTQRQTVFIYLKILSWPIGVAETGLESDSFVGIRFPWGEMKMELNRDGSCTFVLNAIELFTSKWLFLCYV